MPNIGRSVSGLFSYSIIQMKDASVISFAGKKENIGQLSEGNKLMLRHNCFSIT